MVLAAAIEADEGVEEAEADVVPVAVGRRYSRKSHEAARSQISAGV